MTQDTETLKQLFKHYQHVAQSVTSQLALETPNHHVTSGTSRENIWNEVFRNLVPKKYILAQNVFVIDSFGHISAEVDIAIYDEQYTPYIFNYGNILFIPIEAIAIVVQSKSRTLDKDNLKAWVKTVKNLQPVLNAYVRTQQSLLDTNLKHLRSSQSQTATRPIIILCTFSMEEKKIQDLKVDFDMILHLNKEQKLTKSNAETLTTLDEWYEELNHYGHERYGADYQKLKDLAGIKKNTEAKAEEDTVRKLQSVTIELNTLLSLKFELNQLLMLVNNPMFFPHASYVNMFNEALEIESKKEAIKKMAESNDDFLLAVYDITGIQEYIFASNRMQENMGGSYIVGTMVEHHFVKVLEKCASQKKVNVEWKGVSTEESILSKNSIGAEVVYIGGGNALVIYRDWNLYHKVNRKFALKVLEESASLTMVTEAIPFRKDDERTYAALYKELMQKLSETKSKQLRTKLNQTLPIFAQEPFKGDAITHYKDKANVSTEQYLKRQATSENTIFEKYKKSFVKETTDIKRERGEESYIAVVHIDGNGIGNWIKKGLGNMNTNMLESIQKHRTLSQNITALFRDVFGDALDVFKNEQLPMRPLILDGDDVTFICQADLALPFTHVFMEKLQEKSKALDVVIEACAGVAFVHSHFPFELAYEIAEQCCQKAKKQYYDGEQGSYLDFYLVRGSYVKTMDEQRQNQTYLSPRVYSTEQLKKLIDLIYKLNQPLDSWPQSRLIALYQAYLQDEKEVGIVKAEASSRGYEEINKDERMLFDALQLIDFGKGEEWAKCQNMN
ncbi:DUF6602 domain-containing protein [Bacillus ndiopicus]|uniref:DUF6602 domain-containing protein n=1 Tax=Bacillus ndiopicus TaxID=1347368 RepID=UPI0005A5F7DE|nr:DUF6602 domain-containing protein [Bacillus ndiopicus]